MTGLSAAGLTDLAARIDGIDLKGHDGGVWADVVPPGSYGRPDRQLGPARPGPS